MRNQYYYIRSWQARARERERRACWQSVWTVAAILFATLAVVVLAGGAGVAP